MTKCDYCVINKNVCEAFGVCSINVHVKEGGWDRKEIESLLLRKTPDPIRLPQEAMLA